jgi:D-glycero-alpha-D-manno-heptose 1-phosphate guanylyltransferase
MQAIVLAGGLGTRLRQTVPDLPKPMAPVAGRPFLAWVLDRLVRAGFDRIVLAVGYRAEIIRGHFGSDYLGVPLTYSIEDKPLGTGGAIGLAAQGVTESPVFVLNGDTFVEVDYGEMWSAHQRSGALMTLAVCRVPDAGRYGTVEIDNGRVRGFREKGIQGAGAINAGTYLLEREIIDMIAPAQVVSFEERVLVAKVAEIRPVAFEATGLFIDIGVPDDYTRAQRLFASRAARP